jgi:hypothetical protein
MSNAATASRLVSPVQVFPDVQDMAQWSALTPAEQRACIERDEEEGFQSGEAAPETLEQRLARVRES